MFRALVFFFFGYLCALLGKMFNLNSKGRKTVLRISDKRVGEIKIVGWRADLMKMAACKRLMLFKYVDISERLGSWQCRLFAFK